MHLHKEIIIKATLEYRNYILPEIWNKMENHFSKIIIMFFNFKLSQTHKEKTNRTYPFCVSSVSRAACAPFMYQGNNALPGRLRGDIILAFPL